jgi:hypothetical protein
MELHATAEGEVVDVISEGLDVVERQLRLTDLTLVGPMMAEVPGPVGRIQ